MSAWVSDRVYKVIQITVYLFFICVHLIILILSQFCINYVCRVYLEQTRMFSYFRAYKVNTSKRNLRVRTGTQTTNTGLHVIAITIPYNSLSLGRFSKERGEGEAKIDRQGPTFKLLHKLCDVSDILRVQFKSRKSYFHKNLQLPNEIQCDELKY